VFVALFALALVVLASGCRESAQPSAPTSAPATAEPYPTTLDRTFAVVPDPARPGGYTLAVAPGEPRSVRNDLGIAPAHDPDGDPLSVGEFLVVTDNHMTDEESPTRLALFDSNLILNGLFEAAWRAHEDLAPHVLASFADAANAVMARTGRDLDAALALGDLTDNAQRNEVTWGLDALDGAGRSSGFPGILRPDSGLLDIDPDTGLDRGERSLGFQGTDDQGHSIDPFNRPDRPNSNADFAAGGLRGSGGLPLPMLLTIGNHDVLNTGNFDATSALTFFRPEEYVGGLAKFGFQPGLANVVDFVRDHPGRALRIADGLFRLPVNYSRIVPLLDRLGVVPADVSSEVNANFDLDKLVHCTKALGFDDGVPIPADSGRAYLGRGGFIQAANAAGYGFSDNNGDGVVDEADGGWYAIDLGDLRPGRDLPLRLLVLNSTDAGTLDQGGLSPAQVAWVQAELDRAVADAVLVVVLSHHPQAEIGDGGEELRAMLLACPNVVLHLAGHTHTNRITPVLPADGGAHGYWQVETASTLTFPGQSRIVEIVDNRDQTGSIRLTMLDHSALDWENLDDLAALGRWVAFDDELRKGYDGGGILGGMGTPDDRNRELIFAVPSDVAARLAEVPAID
jgi:3',5'-cyclic AMP phosphodiesterase CpdA